MSATRSAPDDEDGFPLFKERLATWTDGQVETVMRWLIAEHRDRQRRAATAAALALRVGDEVAYLRDSRRLPLGARGRVEQVRATSVLVCFHQLGKWRVDATLVAKVGPAAPDSLPKPEA